MNRSGIGVFDSGVGGLSVLSEIQALLPNEKLMYVADSYNMPYGEKNTRFIRKRSTVIADFFWKKGTKAFVMACNTATVISIDQIRQRYPGWVVVGIEPGIKTAALRTQSTVIGVLATSRTLESERFSYLISNFSGGKLIVPQSCPGLVELIETGYLKDKFLRQKVLEYLDVLLRKKCDTVILGCTHYSFLKPLLKEILPPSITLIDLSASVALYLRQLLQRKKLLSIQKNMSKETIIWTSGSTNIMESLLEKLWNRPRVLHRFQH